MEHINQLRAWKNQANKAGLDIKDENYNVVLLAAMHLLDADYKEYNYNVFITASKRG